jgi:hypothetical protein
MPLAGQGELRLDPNIRSIGDLERPCFGLCLHGNDRICAAIPGQTSYAPDFRVELSLAGLGWLSVSIQQPILLFLLPILFQHNYLRQTMDPAIKKRSFMRVEPNG